MQQIIQQIALVYIGGGSDKAYNAALVQTTDNQYVVNFEYGRRGSTLTLGTKTSSPVTLDKAEKIYEKLIIEKRSKGYDLPEKFGLPPAPENCGTIGTTAIQNVAAKAKFGHLPQLLNPITEEEALRLLCDDDYVMQEKHDGERRLARRERQQIQTSNRKGEVIPTAQEIALGLSEELRCVVDGEHVGRTFIIFDILEYNGQPTNNLPYLLRLKTLETVPSSETVQIVQTAHTTEEKIALYESLRANDKEGVVFKHRNAPYTAGRPNSGGDQLKFKFYARVTCRVRIVNEQRSVEVELRDGDQFVSKGNVTIPPNKAIPPIGQLIEVRYLYAYPGEGALYQPTYLGQRDDVCCDDVNSLKYKAVQFELFHENRHRPTARHRSAGRKTPFGARSDVLETSIKNAESCFLSAILSHL